MPGERATPAPLHEGDRGAPGLSEASDLLGKDSRAGPGFSICRCYSHAAPVASESGSENALLTAPAADAPHPHGRGTAKHGNVFLRCDLGSRAAFGGVWRRSCGPWPRFLGEARDTGTQPVGSVRAWCSAAGDPSSLELPSRVVLVLGAGFLLLFPVFLN